jgi:hypothetical protein
MSRQGRLLAGQAVLSALILIVVYVTLLRPEGGGSLTEVETPDGSLPTPGQTAQPGDRDTGDRSRRAGRTAARTPGTTPGVLGGEPLPPGMPATGIEQPTDDQYTDSLGQLRARLAAG